MPLNLIFARPLMTATALAISLLCPGLAGAADPFQSNPGPAPAPHPAPRYHHPAPEPDLPPPAPVVVTPPQADPAQRFDGIWSGRYSCGQGRSLPAFQLPRTAQIKNGQFSIVSGLAPGSPGFWKLTGTIGPDGTVLLLGEGFGNGHPGTPLAVGQRRDLRFNGRFNGSQFTGIDLVTPSERGCELVLSKQS